jgi:hypothetical protein
MLKFSSSPFIKKVAPVLSIFILIPLMVFAWPPDNGPDGIPPGGRFSVYFTNIIQWNDGVSGACPTDQVIIGFNTGLTLNYGKPICKRVITLPDGLTGQTLRNTGTWWVVNSLLYNNGTNVGINTTNPAARLDVNGSLFTRGAQAHYDMSLANAWTTQWVRVWTLTAPQNGVNATLRFYGWSGYNASWSQIWDAVVEFRTSNGASVNASWFCASSIVKRSWRTQVFTNLKIVGNAAWCSATSYDVYILAAAFIWRSYYTVDTDYGTTWSHVLAVGQADPGVASSTVLIPDFENVINENLSVIWSQTVSWNLWVGTPTPGYKLDVSGTGNFTWLRLPTGAGNNYILTSDASGNARWIANNYVESDPQVWANTTNYLSKWNGSALVSSDIIDNWTNIGIGNSVPWRTLGVSTIEWGPLINRALLSLNHLYNTGSNGQNLQIIGMSNAGSYYGFNFVARWSPRLSFGVTTWSWISTIPYETLVINSSNNVWIWTTSPWQKLDVSGWSIRTTNQLISTLATGTSPLSVSSTTVNTNLNADLLDGYTTWNASGNIPLSNGTVNTNLNADLLDGQSIAYFAPIASPALTGTPTAPTAAIATNTTQIATTAFVKNQGYLTGIALSITGTLNIAPIFKVDLIPNGSPAVRTTSTGFLNIQSVYGPFAYAQPSCPAGTTKQYKLFAELVDNISSWWQNVAFRIALSDWTNLDFNLWSTWWGAPNYRTYLSGLFSITNANHGNSQIRINGTAWPYVDMRNAEIWTYCIQ